MAGSRKVVPAHPDTEVDVDISGQDFRAGDFQQVGEAKKLLCRVSGSMRRKLGGVGSAA
jgi:hypothetical protein